MSGGEGDRDAEHFAEQLEAFRDEDSVSSGDSDDEGARGSRAGGGKRRGSLGDGVMGGIFATACSVAPDDGDHRCVKISEKTGVGRKADLLLRSATCCLKASDSLISKKSNLFFHGGHSRSWRLMNCASELLQDRPRRGISVLYKSVRSRSLINQNIENGRYLERPTLLHLCVT